jgi:Uma2 family endonuclease
MEQPDGKRYELVAGEVFAMAPERAVHARTKLRFARRFAEAIEAGHLSCEAFGDGMAVRVDDSTVFEPDALVRCGRPLGDEATEVPDPMIIVEIVSPSSQKRDSGSKLEAYFRIPSVRHYLIVKTENQAIIHHRRDDAGEIATHIVRDGVLRLDPPGLVVTGLFAQ